MGDTLSGKHLHRKRIPRREYSDNQEIHHNTKIATSQQFFPNPTTRNFISVLLTKTGKRALRAPLSIRARRIRAADKGARFYLPEQPADSSKNNGAFLAKPLAESRRHLFLLSECLVDLSENQKIMYFKMQKLRLARIADALLFIEIVYEISRKTDCVNG